MKISGEGSLANLDKCPNSRCRHWRIKFKTDQGTKTRRFCGTYSDAKKALIAFKSELESSVSSETFEGIAHRWITHRTRFNNLSEQTVAKETRIVNRLIEQFGPTRLCDMSRSVCVDGLIELKERRNLGNTYLNSIFGIFKAILEDAVEDGDLPSNPLRNVKAPKVDKANRRSLNQEEIDRLMGALLNQPLDTHTMALLIIVLTGLRRGEVLGLRWCDIKRVGNRVMLEVNRSITDNGHVKLPKTPSGVREVPLCGILVEAIASWQSLQARQFSYLGIEQSSETYICASEIGGVMCPPNLGRWWRNHREDYGLPNVVLHELRHTFFTVMGNSGASGAAMKSIAGWSSIAESDTYVHDDRAAMFDAIDRITSVYDHARLGGTSGGTTGGTNDLLVLLNGDA